jgi:hypothetical protein
MKQSAESDCSAFLRNITMQQQQLLFVHQKPFLKITIAASVSAVIAAIFLFCDSIQIINDA